MAPPKRRKRSRLTRDAFAFPAPDAFSPLQARALAPEGGSAAIPGPDSDTQVRPSGGPIRRLAPLDTQGPAGTEDHTEHSGTSTEDTGFSTDMETEERLFASRREFMCYGYLFGSARVSTRQYDMMRETENSFCPGEAWPSLSRLEQLKNKLMKSAAATRTQTTARNLPTGKGRALRRLPDASVHYIPFSEHIKRDFGDAASAHMFHEKGDSDVGSIDCPAEFFQTVVAAEPSSKNYRSGFRLNGTLYTVGCTISAGNQLIEHLEATLVSTDIADDGDISVSKNDYASPAALRVGDFVATFSLNSASDGTAPFLKPDGTFLLRFTRSGGIFICCVRASADASVGSWSFICTAECFVLLQQAPETQRPLPEKDPYKVLVNWYADEYGTFKRRRGDIEAHYGCYASISQKFRSYSVRPLFYLPPGADPEPLVRAVIKDLLLMSKDGLLLYDAFKKEHVRVFVYPCLGIFHFPMAAKASNTIGPAGAEHCTSCDIVIMKTRSERKSRAMSSSQCFDVRDVRFCRIQERTKVITDTVVASTDSSAQGVKAALLLNGISRSLGTHFQALTDARGPGSFDIHEHVIAAPSHLLFYGLTAPLLQAAYEALTVLQRDAFHQKMRACSAVVPGSTILASFEPERMGGTTLSMSDYSVLLTIALTVIDRVTVSAGRSERLSAAQAALMSLRGFTNSLFYSPSLAADGERAVRTRPTVSQLQDLGESVLKRINTLSKLGGKWEKPNVHRLLELLLRTMPLVQLGPSICELVFEKFHQVSKAQLMLCNGQSPSSYSMQRWREAEVLARVVTCPQKFNVPQAWLMNAAGKQMKAVSRQLSGPRIIFLQRPLQVWTKHGVLQGIRPKHPALWHSSAPDATTGFWKTARNKLRRFKVDRGSSIAALSALPVVEHPSEGHATVADLPRLEYFLVDDIATINGALHFACRLWVQSNPVGGRQQGQPTRVSVHETAPALIIPSEQVKQLVLVLRFNEANLLFDKCSGFTFKGA